MSGKEEQTGRTKYAAPALERGLGVLECLAGEEQGLTLSEIARSMDLSAGQIFRILVVLEARGYIALESGTDRYHLTLKLFELSHSHAPIKLLTNAAAPIMNRLVRDCEQSCHLVVFSGDRGRVVLRLNSPADRGFSVRLGADVALINSCSGHVALAFSTVELRADMLAAQPAKLKTLARGRVFREVLEGVRERGYENIPSLQVAGVQDIAFPVFNNSGSLVATLCVPYLARLDGGNKTDPSGTIDLLREAAAAVSRGLGYLGGDS